MIEDGNHIAARRKPRRRQQLAERRRKRAVSTNAPSAARETYRVARSRHGEIRDTRRHAGLPQSTHAAEAVSGVGGDRLFFLAEKQSDGTYAITLTEEGVQTFETALGIADDLGGKTRISSFSTIADIMERTATREELSYLLRQAGTGMLYHSRMRVLRRKLRGSEKPSLSQRTIGHVGKAVILGIIALWTLQQFVIAIQDIADIPGILAGIPGDLIQLHPTSAFGDVGNKISDAGYHVVIGALGCVFTYIAAKLIRPFGRIYRKDQILPGERVVLGLIAWTLGKAYARSGHHP
jgi:hypothetical protein